MAAQYKTYRDCDSTPVVPGSTQADAFAGIAISRKYNAPNINAVRGLEGFIAPLLTINNRVSREAGETFDMVKVNRFGPFILQLQGYDCQLKKSLEKSMPKLFIRSLSQFCGQVFVVAQSVFLLEDRAIKKLL